MSWTYADLTTYDLLTTYGALEVTEVPTTPGRMTPLAVGVATLLPTTATVLAAFTYDGGTYDAPNPYDWQPGTLRQGVTVAARITAAAAGVATMRATTPTVLPALTYDGGTYDAPNPYDYDGGPGTITPYGG